MTPANQQYTLVGFKEELDWKPLHFVKPLPKNRLCSLCGLVRKTAAHLPCGHSACSSCYRQCKSADGYVCPIDGENCPEEDADWRDYPAEKLLIREVKCWNQRHGCPLMMAASEVHKHFHRECEFHCASCPRCSVMVLCRDMGEHMRASCNAHAAPQATECEEMLSDAVETRISTIVTKVVQEQAGEMKALLERALGNNGVLHGSLTEICQTVNVLKESVKQDISNEVSKQTHEICQSVNSLKEKVSQSIAPVGQISEMTHHVLDGINALPGVLNRNTGEISNQNAEEFSRVRAAIESAKKDAGASTKTMLEMQKKALAYAEENETRCDFFIPGVESLESKAMKDGEASHYYDQVYLRRYNISPGVVLQRKEEGVFLNVAFRIHRGDHDAVIQWPFEHRIMFTILHPAKNEKKEFIRKTMRTTENYRKPENACNTGIYFVECLNLGQLKTAGYVLDDSVRVIFEIL
ncbi:hypothetical protein MTO96_036627 [Rhipicephalus appendiculatus]